MMANKAVNPSGEALGGQCPLISFNVILEIELLNSGREAS